MARTRPSCWSFSIVGQRLVAGHRQVTHPDAGRPVDGVGDGGPSTRPRPTHSSSARTTSSSWPSTACRSSPGTRSPKDATTCSPTPPSARSVPRTASPSLRSCCAGSSVATSSSSPSPFGPTECGRRRRLRLRAPDVGQPSCQQRPGLTVVFDRGSSYGAPSCWEVIVTARWAARASASSRSALGPTHAGARAQPGQDQQVARAGCSQLPRVLVAPAPRGRLACQAPRLCPYSVSSRARFQR
jgi:hypothetical protein